MSRLNLLIIIACLAFAAQSQTNSANDPAGNPNSQATIIQNNTSPATTPWEKTITCDKYVHGILDNFTYWDEFFESSFTTTYSSRLNHATNRVDSIITVQDKEDKYTFTKTGSEWLISSFTIKRINITLNHVHVGQTAKEAFKFLGAKAPKEKITGQLYVQDKSGRQLIFVFADDKIVSMHY